MENTTRNTVIATLVLLFAIAIGFFAGANMDNSETTPEACLTALNHADDAQANASEGFYLLSSGIREVENGDATALALILMDMRDLTPKMVESVESYQGAAADCRALADD